MRTSFHEHGGLSTQGIKVDVRAHDIPRMPTEVQKYMCPAQRIGG